jgi:hypothetical protein
MSRIVTIVGTTKTTANMAGAAVVRAKVEGAS